MSALALPAVPQEGSLSTYFREIWKFPILERDEEYMLAQRWKMHEDLDAAHTLVTSHLRLVAKIASGYRGYGLPLADLVSEGNIGLMQAVKKFEPEKGFRLSTYAMWWIRASIIEYVLKSWSLVKMGSVSAQKKLFFSLTKMKKKLGLANQITLTPDQVTTLSQTMNVSERDVVDMHQRMTSNDVSLNAPLSGEDGASTFQDTIKSDEPSPEVTFSVGEEGALRADLLREALKVLDNRERHIITERKLREDPVTLEELGRHYGISRERVRQLEARAFDKLQTAVIEAAPNVLH